MFRIPAQQFQRVGQNIEHGLQGFHGGFGAARQIQYQSLSKQPTNATAQGR
jgi:hypothetical protein